MSKELFGSCERSEFCKQQSAVVAAIELELSVLSLRAWWMDAPVPSSLSHVVLRAYPLPRAPIISIQC